MDKKKLQEIQKHLPDHVTLIAVSKTHTKEEIDAFIEVCKKGDDFLDAFFK